MCKKTKQDHEDGWLTFVDGISVEYGWFLDDAPSEFLGGATPVVVVSLLKPMLETMGSYRSSSPSSINSTRSSEISIFGRKNIIIFTKGFDLPSVSNAKTNVTFQIFVF